jgi:hypothetical protein
LQPDLFYCRGSSSHLLFFLGNKFNITSLITIRRDMSEVILNLVPKKEKYKGVRTSAIQEIKLQNYLPEESFSPVPVKY